MGDIGSNVSPILEPLLFDQLLLQAGIFNAECQQASECFQPGDVLRVDSLFFPQEPIVNNQDPYSSGMANQWDGSERVQYVIWLCYRCEYYPERIALIMGYGNTLALQQAFRRGPC